MVKSFKVKRHYHNGKGQEDENKKLKEQLETLRGKLYEKM
ncbi:hypothetical protein EUAN_13550 [Andreesenia angusta]|uniref:Uncharacterized protein n=1 Tax=Andreesenia angusta TaxID=39480 RepID=A0A1S1V777_9FIRM|nr:hypothetical protein EUAN_13550 [Andreesenia angusta]